MVAEPPQTAENRNTAALIHLSGIFGAVPPLIVWALTRKSSHAVNEQGIEALNFQIQVAILEILLAIAGIIWLSTFFFLAPLYIYRFILCVWAAFQTKQDGAYRYPMLFTRWLRVSVKAS